MPTEFDIIRQYFTFSQTQFLSEPSFDVAVGIGDDAAILNIPEHHQLVQSVDTLIAGVHFPIETTAADIAYKALAVNLSDMAAMGAKPAWFTLAITLPTGDVEWLKEFSQSLSSLSKKYHVQLVGGDTTHGQTLSISITINGFIPQNKALLRSNAKVGDRVFVSGTIGDAALALAAWKGQCLLSDDNESYLNARLNRPIARIELGILLRDYASACIDISDGLIADLSHITESSDVGALINYKNIPLSSELKSSITDQALIQPLVLSGGDDYELCFTIPKDKQKDFEKSAQENKFKVTCIGEIVKDKNITCLLNNKEIETKGIGYNHFSA